MIVSLDTNVVVDIARGLPEVRSRLRERIAAGQRVVLSAIALEELSFGASISGNPERQRQQLTDALIGIGVEAVTPDDAVAIARYRAIAESRGRRLSAYDGLIAGHAHARGWAVVTADAGFTANAMDLTIENWRMPA